MDNNGIQVDEPQLYNLASFIGCEPHNEERHRKDLLNYVTGLLEQAQLEARLDELNETVIAQGTYAEDRSYGHGSFHHVPYDEVQKRIAEITAQLSTPPKKEDI